jgi:hypothetical protein
MAMMVMAVIVAAAARIMMFVIVGLMMVVRMIMVVVIVPVVVVGMIMSRLISATLRLEWRVDGNHLGTECREQFLNRRIALQPQPLLQNLHRHVTVAEMPGEPGQRRQIGRARLDQRFGVGNNLDQRAVIENQRVVGAKPHMFREIQLDAGAFDAEQEALLRLPLRVRKDQRVDDVSALPLGSGLNAGGAWHG